MTTTDDRGLSVVRNPFAPIDPVDAEGFSSVVPSDIPSFEGQPVAATKAKVTSAASLEIEDRVLRMDDMVTLLVQCRVVSIDHRADEKTGFMFRIHTLKAIDSKLIKDADYEVLKGELT